MGGNSIVQIFDIDTIGEEIVGLVYDKHMHHKTIMIRVKNGGDFNVPTNCFHPEDALSNEAPICGRDMFPPRLTSSILWLFESSSHIEIKGIMSEMQGSVVKPYGDLTELHNYEFDPPSGPLPLGDDIDELCTVAPPAVCDESYKVLTGNTVCPSAPNGIVTLLKSS